MAGQKLVGSFEYDSGIFDPSRRFWSREPTEMAVNRLAIRRKGMQPADLIQNTIELGFDYPLLLLRVREFEVKEKKSAKRRFYSATYAFMAKKRHRDNGDGDDRDPGSGSGSGSGPGGSGNSNLLAITDGSVAITS